MGTNSPAIVCDAGPLIHLDELDSLALLADFGPILVPGQVWDEVNRHRPGIFNSRQIDLQRKPVEISANLAFQTLAQAMSLDLGEQAALSLMETHPQAILLTDDAVARLAGLTLGYQVHGSIGILLRAIRREQRTSEEVKALLQSIPHKSTLFIRPGLLREIIANLTPRE